MLTRAIHRRHLADWHFASYLAHALQRCPEGGPPYRPSEDSVGPPPGHPPPGVTALPQPRTSAVRGWPHWTRANARGDSTDQGVEPWEARSWRTLSMRSSPTPTGRCCSNVDYKRAGGFTLGFPTRRSLRRATATSAYGWPRLRVVLATSARRSLLRSPGLPASVSPRTMLALGM
jgi:hypothetical protein